MSTCVGCMLHREDLLWDLNRVHFIRGVTIEANDDRHMNREKQRY
jgi:hypothetical protein